MSTIHPSSVQLLVKGNDSAARPLVLVHDGGGTVAAYRSLGAIEGDIYAISDPRFNDGLPWDGGIPEMAKVYLGLVKQAVPAREILIGGWSFGGLVAVEMAAVAFEDPRLGVDIQGMILIDAPYSCFDSRPLHEIIYGDMPDLPGMAPRQRRRIWASIQRAREMIVDWGSHCAGDDGLNMGTVQQKDVKLPPAVLLRCTDLVRTSDQSVAVVDSCRNDAKLGWGQYGAEFIEVVWNVPGSHYSLFEGQNIRLLNERLGSACAYLASRAVTSSFDVTERCASGGDATLTVSWMRANSMSSERLKSDAASETWNSDSGVSLTEPKDDAIPTTSGELLPCINTDVSLTAGACLDVTVH